MRAGPAHPSDFAEVFRSAHWHQRWEVAPGLFTPGTNSVARLMSDAEVPQDLSGKRVLDVGTYNGCCAFECERRGAPDVVALDIMNPVRTGFTALHAALGSRVKYVRASAYELDPDLHGCFDLVLFFGVLYHLRYPLLALDRLRTVCGGELRLETHVIEGYFTHPSRMVRTLGRLAVRASRRLPMWRQYRARELHPEDGSNFFGPNVAAVLASLGDCGFDGEVLQIEHNRATFRASVDATRQSRVARDSYEARHPYTARLAGVPLREDPLFEPPPDAGVPPS